jgi:hypothetical protein
VDEARQQARANGIKLAISNPCFELWALLHFQDQSADLSRQAARRQLKHHIPEYEKVLPFHRLASGYEQAVERAKDLDHRCETAGCPGGNPSTGVHALTERIRLGAQL